MTYTKFEESRIIGARALQLALGAPPVVKAKGLFKPLDMALAEYKKNAIPITVLR